MVKHCLFILVTIIVINFSISNLWATKKSAQSNPYENYYFHNQKPKTISKNTKLESTFYFSDLLKTSPILTPVNPKKKTPTYLPKTNID